MMNEMEEEQANRDLDLIYLTIEEFTDELKGIISSKSSALEKIGILQIGGMFKDIRKKLEAHAEKFRQDTLKKIKREEERIQKALGLIEKEVVNFEKRLNNLANERNNTFDYFQEITLNPELMEMKLKINSKEGINSLFKKIK